jgi:nitrite reductase (NO-forming)
MLKLEIQLPMELATIRTLLVRKFIPRMCISCHQKNGEGVVGAFPPLANSDYLLADVNRSIDIVKNGMQGEIVVNGQTYNGIMANQGLTDEEVRDVTNYILNAWGNKGWRSES